MTFAPYSFHIQQIVHSTIFPWTNIGLVFLVLGIYFLHTCNYFLLFLKFQFVVQQDTYYLHIWESTICIASSKLKAVTGTHNK